MKRILIIIFLTFSFNSFSQTQAEMNKKAFAEFEKSDKELNKVYQKILTEYKSDTIFIKNLITAERIWTKFRDAELAMKYPKREYGYYGSIQPMCRNLYLKELTEKRIETLKMWIDGIKEGDSCNGSVKLN